MKLRVESQSSIDMLNAPMAGTLANTYATIENKKTDYVGNMIYENGQLTKILVDGGYIEDGQYHFYLTDHLGNNRVVVNQRDTIIQTNHYYPFGMPFAETSTTEQGKQPYKFGNKELDQMHGLNFYDVSARYMNGINFTSVDPLAEKYYSWSPYLYCANNPLRFIDPDGKQFTIPILGGGSPLLGASEVVTVSSTTVASLGSLSRVGSMARTPIARISRVPTGIEFSPTTSESVSTMNKGDVKHGLANQERTDERLDTEKNKKEMNFNENMDKNAPDGKGNAKRTIQELIKSDASKAVVAGAALGAGAVSRIIIEGTNPDASKDAYDAHLKNAQDNFKKRTEEEKDK